MPSDAAHSVCQTRIENACLQTASAARTVGICWTLLSTLLFSSLHISSAMSAATWQQFFTYRALLKSSTSAID